MTITLNRNIDIDIIECHTCSVPMYFTAAFLRKRMDDHVTFYCPNGHSNAYLGKTIFDDIEEIPNFCDLILQYSLSIYQAGNYILISNVKLEINSAIIKITQTTAPPKANIVRLSNICISLVDVFIIYHSRNLSNII